MKIKVKLVSLPGHQPAGFDEFGNATMRLEAGTVVSDLLARLSLSDRETYMVLVNGETVPPSERGAYRLAEGDEATVFPPMEGG